MQRFLRRLLLVVCALAPYWLVLPLAHYVVARHDARQSVLDEPVSSVKTPNPAKAPVSFLNHAEVLVYADPYWAGILSGWYALGALGMCVGVWLVRAATPPGKVAVCGLLLGVVFSLPWLAALAMLLRTESTLPVYRIHSTIRSAAGM